MVIIPRGAGEPVVTGLGFVRRPAPGGQIGDTDDLNLFVADQSDDVAKADRRVRIFDPAAVEAQAAGIYHRFGETAALGEA